MTWLASGLPVDWTNGTGVLPAGGVITIPANKNRKWLYVQNLDITALTVGLASVEAIDFATASTPTVPLPAAATAGAAGGALDRTLTNFMPLGAITITGTAGKQVVALEG